MDIDDMATIFKDAVKKYQAGEQKYGKFEPMTDQRDMITETEAEILDAINYLAMFLMKIRAMGKGGNHEGNTE